MKDTIEIREQGGAGRMIHLAPELRKAEQPKDTEDGEVCLYIYPHSVNIYL